MWISTVTCEDKVSKVYRKRHQWRFSRRKRICGWPKSFPNLYFSKKTSSAISNSFLSTSPTSTYCASATGVTPSEGGIRWQREQAQRNCIRCGWAAARIQKLRSGAESQKKQEVSWEKGWESLSVWHTGVFSLPLHVGGGVQVPFSRHLLLPTPSMA